MNTPPEPMAYNIREAAALVHVSERTIRRAIASGGLRAVRIGRAVRVPRESLTALLSRGLSCADAGCDTAVSGVRKVTPPQVRASLGTENIHPVSQPKKSETAGVELNKTA